MERLAYGFAQHKCEAIGTTILIPIGLEKYNSKVLVSAKCHVCGKTEMDKTIDRSFAPAKADYMTV